MRPPSRRRLRHAGLPPIRGDEDLSVLIVRAADGDAAAEAAFVARTIDDVWRFCAHLVGPGQADDATQAAYVRALRSLGSFRGDSSARTWLLGVARNTCLDERRSLARRMRLLERITSQPIDALDRADHPHGQVELDELLAALDPDRREAFVLTQVLGFPYEEAAIAVGCPVGTIRSRVARARRDLLAMVGDAEAGAADEPVRFHTA
jgi:RNA polymerase sigma-70 factor (ECF subfamily)